MEKPPLEKDPKKKTLYQILFVNNVLVNKSHKIKTPLAVNSSM